MKAKVYAAFFWMAGASLSAGAGMTAGDLPVGAAPEPVAARHFPDALHAFVWRNWQLVPAERMAEVVGAKPGEIVALGHAMGLAGPPPITQNQRRRSYIGVIKRNWHLLPYDQLLALLGWNAEELDYALREDDFLFIKLGQLKPKCGPVRWSEPDDRAKARAAEIARIVREEFSVGVGEMQEPLFDFVRQLSEPIEKDKEKEKEKEAGWAFEPRYCHSYFALYGDPLLETEADPYPDGYLARLAATGVDGVWLQGVLYKLAPFPWDESVSARHEERLAALRALCERAKRRGIGVWLYMNEPRTMPLKFFEGREEIRGVEAQGFASMCTSAPQVREWMKKSVESICRAAPDLAGFFTITASENRTNCWSHGGGAKCPRCAPRGPAETIADVNGLIQEGIDAAGGAQRLIAWDWGWSDEWAPQAIARLPKKSALMSVSEWSLPIERGGIKSAVGEYSISSIGPGPRAKRHWAIAKENGLRTMAKIQAGTTWELGSVPYVPAVENVARHISNLREAGPSGLMLGWTLGGFPSPNLEAVAAMSRKGSRPEPGDALRQIGLRRFGEPMADAAVAAWTKFSAAFSEYPYNIGLVYSGPHHNGPANPLWEKPTGYRGTMVGFPYDDLAQWRAVYPAEIFVQQFEKVADGFDAAIAELKSAAGGRLASPKSSQDRELARELDVAEACAIHFRSAANQGRFVRARDALAAAKTAAEAAPLGGEIEKALRGEIDLARRLHAIQSRDSRIGYEATNHYFYVPVDLAEKVLNCRDLLDRWLPAERAKPR